ncbi:ABC transporter ATP-binding protein [Acuticoccus sediminis]|uniref:ABC transporter ATP-binding protein n=1 Tax=Acuticoccus sediminis TaxID=2184697 RepID=A0A8B2P2A2_9HYPH|nr:ABC transporter ATP-binding protein [Acuticoccus sediminis]RAI04074.1 ABC transporter ATP-binding protein [Acuticoccus sediminis]
MSDIAIETEGLTKQFGGFYAVQGVNLKVRRHSIHALIGPNGAGKSTCFNLITKFLTPSAGTIRLEGKDITHVKPAALARRGMVRSFQISSVFPHLTCRENVRVALQRQMKNSYQFWTPESVLNALNDEVDAILQSVGLFDMRDTLAVELSYGRKRLLELATTLALKPDVLLFDEPMAGMSTGDIQRVVDLIRTAAEGRTVLMVEHNMGVVADLCDTITVLQRGQVLAEGSYEEVSKNPEVIAAYMGGHA